MADRTGWCPVEPVALSRRCSPASMSWAMPPSWAACPNRPSRPTPRPRSAPRPSSSCWPAASRSDPILINTCYSLLAPDYGISVAGVYRPDKGQLADIPGAGGTAHSRWSAASAARKRFMPRAGSRPSRRDLRLTGRAGLLAAALALVAGRAWAQVAPPYTVVGDAIPKPLTGKPATPPAVGPSWPTAASASACFATAGRLPRSASRATWRPSLAGAGARWSGRSCGCASSTARVSMPTRSCRPIIGRPACSVSPGTSRARPS